jgi:hypothetical protein
MFWYKAWQMRKTVGRRAFVKYSLVIFVKTAPRHIKPAFAKLLSETSPRGGMG